MSQVCELKSDVGAIEFDLVPMPPKLLGGGLGGRGRAFALCGIDTQTEKVYRSGHKRRSSAAGRKSFWARRSWQGTARFFEARCGKVSLGKFRFGEVWRSRIDQTLTERDHDEWHTVCLEEAFSGHKKRLSRKNRATSFCSQGIRGLVERPTGSPSLFLVLPGRLTSVGGGLQ